MGIQPIWSTKQKKFSLLGIEIYSHVENSDCSVPQIGCISMEVQGVYRSCPIHDKGLLVQFLTKSNIQVKVILAVV